MISQRRKNKSSDGLKRSLEWDSLLVRSSDLRYTHCSVMLTLSSSTVVSWSSYLSSSSLTSLKAIRQKQRMTTIKRNKAKSNMVTTWVLSETILLQLRGQNHLAMKSVLKIVFQSWNCCARPDLRWQLFPVHFATSLTASWSRFSHRDWWSLI